MEVADAGRVTVHANRKPMAECHIPSKASQRLVIKRKGGSAKVGGLEGWRVGKVGKVGRLKGFKFIRALRRLEG